MGSRGILSCVQILFAFFINVGTVPSTPHHHLQPGILAEVPDDLTDLLGYDSDRFLPFDDIGTLYENPNLRPTDLIEIRRESPSHLGDYSHWALYSETPGFVYHTQIVGWLDTSAEFRHDNLIQVANQSLLRINNKVGSAFHQQKLLPRPVHQVLKDARDLVGTRVPYNMATQNCEWYVTRLKYGRGFTEQVRKNKK